MENKKEDLDVTIVMFFVRMLMIATGMYIGGLATNREWPIETKDAVTIIRVLFLRG